MRIGIMTPDLNSGDAVSNDASGMYRALRKAGHDVALFTIRGTSATPWETFCYSDIDWKLQSPRDLLFYHYCTPDPLALAILRRAQCRIVMKYHNITPSRFMAPYSPVLTAATRAGRFMLDDFLALPIELYVGDSTYNVEEVARLTAGQAATRVLAPFHQAEMLVASPDDGATTAFLARHSSNLLNVGRVVPNKGHEGMLRALARYNMRHQDRPHLHIIGSHDSRLGAYLDFLRRLIHDLGLDGQVTFHSNVVPSALASYYRHSQIYWTGSRHEGFCVPVVEAMAFGLPVLSSQAGALVETCGDAAALADEPDAMAHALGTMLSDDEELIRYRRAGLSRFASSFAQDKLTRDFLGLIGELSTGPVASAAIRIREHDWFGLPDATSLVEEALAFRQPATAAALYSRDARLNLIRWMLEAGHRRSAVIEAGLASGEFRDFAANIAVPAAASHLSPAARLAWFVTPAAQEVFRLTEAESVRDYTRWFWREAVPTMALAPLMTQTERAFLAPSGDTEIADRAA